VAVSTTGERRASESSASGDIYEDELAGAGWIVFAIVMMGLAGAFNIIDGIVAVSKSSFFIQDAHYVFSDLNTWGWIVLLLGCVQLLAAFGLTTGSQAARWFGIAVAGINAIGQLMFAPAYPWWSLAMFSLDILVIYALAAYGGRYGPARGGA
jgi:hypothetical protein